MEEDIVSDDESSTSTAQSVVLLSSYDGEEDSDGGGYETLSNSGEDKSTETDGTACEQGDAEDSIINSIAIPVFYRQLVEPKLLQCGHSLCPYCVGRLTQPKAEVSSLHPSDYRAH